MGGPNICLEHERQIAYLDAHPEIDVYVLGEGDFLGARRRPATSSTPASRSPRFGEREMPSCIYPPSDGEAGAHTDAGSARRRIDEIPSPWLTGVLDEFFDGKLAPMIETNRGCPFTCTFCVQGVRWYTKVHYFSQGPPAGGDRLHRRVAIKEQLPEMGFLRIADSNYGMFERDIEISSYIGEIAEEVRLADVHRRDHRQEPARAHHRVAREGQRRASCSTRRCSRSTTTCCENIKRAEHQARKPTSR